ncbi:MULTISPECIES: hypothetical protein [unclassified Streptomyces]|nr:MULTISPECIES: hypothetical protein [unclassified Streptomyces]MCX5142485.1 hypothetical protein [Streptomyces sp. NBC_00338]WRZ66932.1 hypothetical protein OG408_24995 [Streptomyces sp. NBC_01257]WSU60941.1 hypothetical protein OG450_25255 [Streptomyces sp. NBC_01104]
MTRLIPLILIGLGLYFWFKARKRAAAYVEDAESDGGAPRR